MENKRIAGSISIMVLAGLLFARTNFAETITLKSGRRVQGTVIQKTGEKIRVDTGGGMLRTYDLSDVKSIDGRKVESYRPNVKAQEEKKELPLVQEKDALDKGIDYLDNQMYNEAIAEFTRAIAINPSDADAYYSRGLAYSLKQKYDNALEDMRKAAALGYAIEPEFLERLKRASDREKSDSSPAPK